MIQYHKIQTIFKRDMTSRQAPIIIGDYSLPEFEYLKDNTWIFDEKVDGTNIRVMWNGLSVTFGGKTDNAQLPVFLLYKLQELFEGTVKRQVFADVFNNDSEGVAPQVCMYGEGYGAKIQKGGGNYIKDGVDFVLFDVNINGIWLLREDVEEIGKAFGIKITPIIGEGTIEQAIAQVRMGFPSQWGDFTAEGLILRPRVQMLDRRGHRIITKIKHKDFK